MKNKVLVVDLDGTLFKINTFHYFIRYLLLYSINKFNIILLFKIAGVIVFRILKIITHAKMKYFILNTISAKTDINYNQFVNKISFKKREIDLLKDNSFDVKILATAAPLCYAGIIAENEGFHICLGTNFPVTRFNNEFENIKEIKKNRVVNYLAKEGVSEIDTFITDHIDDLPLMKIAKQNTIVAPSNYLKALLKKNQISFREIR